MEREVSAILIDLDDTLYDYHSCNNYALKRVLTRLSITFEKPEDILEQIFHESRKNVKKYLGNTAASHSRFLYIQKTIESLNGKTNLALTHELYELFWESYLEKMKLREGALDFLTHIKQMGIKIAIITDLTAPIQFKKIMKLGLQDYIDFVITSEEAGKDKPENEIFDIAMEKLGCTKEEVAIIGDDIEKEIYWAKKFEVRHYHLDEFDFQALLEQFKNIKRP